jgi:hydroxymethylbilane synthase
MLELCLFVKMKIRIATRKSELAIIQAKYVAKKLTEFIDLDIELVPLLSEGDQTQKPLHEIGGKGLFVNKLESALISNEADIAVHSLKDVPAKLDSDFIIAAVFERESPMDILLSKDGSALINMPSGSVIGTSSPRRKSQILNLRPDIKIVPVRGNIGLIVAKAALSRLDLKLNNSYELSLEEMLPAASQGFIGVECLSSNNKIINILNKINNKIEFKLAEAERKFIAALNGTCLSPIAIYCCNKNNKISIMAKVLSQNGEEKLFKTIESDYKSLDVDIVSFAHDFIKNDANKIILK